MSISNVFQISSQGMTAQRERLEAAAANLANANTTRAADGSPYRRRDVVLETATVSEPSQQFGSVSSGAGNLYDSIAFGAIFDSATQGQKALGVRSTTTVADASDVVRRYQPGHPDADADGYVSMPDVDPLEETVNMLSAARSFEANATAFNTAKEMARTSLKLGDA